MNRLSDLRNEKSLNMAEMAKLLSIPYTTYVGYEKGERGLNSDTLKLISDKLDVSIDYILGRTDIKKTAIQKNDGKEKEYSVFREELDLLSDQNIEKLKEYALFLLQQQKAQDVQ